MVKVAFPLLFLNLCIFAKSSVNECELLKMINNPGAKKVNEEQIYHKLLFSH